MLGALGRFKYDNHPSNLPLAWELSTEVRVPRLLFANGAESTLVIEDFGPRTLHLTEQIKEDDHAMIHGYAVLLGSWLRGFHQWANESAQGEMRSRMRQNQGVGAFRRGITYNGIYQWCEDLGLMDEDTHSLFQKLEHMIAQEFADSQWRDVDAEWGPIHGDFWTGK